MIKPDNQTSSTHSSGIMQFIGRLSLSLVIAVFAYFFVYRPWQINWGSTAAEINRPMVGDEFVAGPTFNATRAVSIAATPEQIWPWLVQIGHKRAGWYSYDLLDNLARPSATRIIPELQNLKSGDLIPISPNGKIGFRVNDLEKPRWLLWGGKKECMTWVWGLYPLDSGHTRLISRVRLTYDWFKPVILGDLALDVGDFVMMRQCLLGIKARAEGKAAAALCGSSIEFFAWIITFAGFIIAEVRIVTRRLSRHWFIAAILAGAITIGIVMVKPPLWLDILSAFCIWVGLWLISRAAKKIHPN